MQGKLICSAALLIVLASGCGRSDKAKTLAQRLSKSDHVIVLNYDGATMTVTNDLLKRLVQAIATAPEIDGGDTLTATPGVTLVFYKSGVHLATVPTGAEIVFYIDKKAYKDEMGVLHTVWEKFEVHQSKP